jgi:ATP-binding protein involved in chromosome partitioning
MFFKSKTIPATEADIRSAVEALRDPVSLIEAGADIESIVLLPGGHAVMTLTVDPARGPALEGMRHAAEKAVMSLPGIHKATAILTAQKAPTPPPEARSARDPHGMDKNPRLELPIRQIIAVASGKGGVGKSTVAMNLAVALAARGLKTGLLDADIYGPSVPKLCGLEGQKPQQNEQGQLLPLTAHGLKIMSIGFMVEGAKALIWRGPMVQTALYQMLRDVAWGSADDMLDILIVDMPPGTGDAQLTLAQKVPVTGAVIVSTPQDIALIDARKAVEMFRTVNVPILGLIENMATHVCSNCGHEDSIFGHGGAEEEAARLGVPFLGRLPLHAEIRQKSDAGEPVTEAAAEIFKTIVEQINLSS